MPRFETVIVPSCIFFGGSMLPSAFWLHRHGQIVCTVFFPIDVL
jgi:hypothetical protein